MFGYHKLAEIERLTGRLPDWCGATEAEDHARWCFDPGTIAIASLALAGVSTVVQMSATSAAGKAEQAAAEARAQSLDHQAKQARQAAGQERAMSQRAAIEKRREGRIVASNALARAAASGAGPGDPTVENILGDIGAEGEFRALSELFIGEERARNLEAQADARVFEAGGERRAGAAARRIANRQAFGQGLAGASKIGFAAYDMGLGTSGGSGTGLSRYQYRRSPGGRGAFG